ncbi:MAG: hypothetical protein COV36_05075 [Alphaproteobacteria bacterium CG11_big_fil_rev_8_21_14_0_20_44_7]|nr:MAG: hypothetical protein COV36_05075 [Alphaproteobacteria bacterium CG11_big_fil_rev_8_21_14_0_20_44_7]
MFKNFIFALVVVMLVPVVVAAPAYSAEIQSPKIVVVDIQRILNESTAAKDLSKQIEEKRDQYQSQITAEENSLKKKEEDLVKQKNILSKDALAAKQKEFINDVNEVRKGIQEKKLKLDNAYKKSLGNIQQEVSKIIEEMAAEQGFNIAMPTSQLVFANADLDISSEVLKKLNSSLPKTSLKFE